MHFVAQFQLICNVTQLSTYTVKVRFTSNLPESTGPVRQKSGKGKSLIFEPIECAGKSSRGGIINVSLPDLSTLLKREKEVIIGVSIDNGRSWINANGPLAIDQ